MALVLADRVRETTTVVGTGTATLLGAVTGYQSFTAVGNANTTYYVIASQAANEWEVGIGTYTASGTTLSRDTVLSSSNAGALVNFTAGTKDIWVDYAAGKAVTTDTLAYPPAIGGTTPAAGSFTSVTVPVASGNAVISPNTSITSWLYSGKSFFIGSQESSPTGLFIGSAGTKMYVNGSTGDDVNEYTLGTAWDITTATFVTVFSTAAQDTAPVDLFFKPDGLSMYVVGDTNNTVFQYTLGTAWSVATAAYASKSFSVGTQETNPSGLWFKPDGTVMYVIGSATDAVYQYTLSTAWDVSTASYGGIFYSIAAQESAPTQVNLSDDGLKMWLLGSTGDDIWEYNLGTAWNVSTATPVNNFYIGFQSISPNGMFIDSTAANRVFVVDSTQDAVYQYNTATNSAEFNTDKLYTPGTLSVNGNFVAGANAYVDGTLTVQGTLNIGGTSNFASVNATGTVSLGTSTGAQTAAFATGATISGSLKTVNIGTAGVSGSTTNINIGSAVSGSLGTTTISAPTVNIGQTATQFAVTNTASAVNYVQATGGATGFQPIISVQGTDANVGPAFSAKGTGRFDFYTQGLTSRQFTVENTSSAVNFVQVTGAATNNRPTASSQGSDTDIGFNIVTKGSGTHNFASDANIGTSQFQVTRTQASAVNYLTATGAATNFSPRLFAAGTDTNISQVFQSKGTGAINLAAGSSGVNISNGGTVTAITRTAIGSGYTTLPSVAITAPTTAGGVQATATPTMFNSTATVAGGGTGYTVGDVLTMVGGATTGGAGTYTVSTVSAGVITGITTTASAVYTVLPTNPVSITGGTGTGATLTVTYGVNTAFTITNAGSGYVEQPTVTFSGGGGSGAAAYATVGGTTSIRSLGTNLDFFTPVNAAGGAPSFRVYDNQSAGTGTYFATRGSTSSPLLIALGGTNTPASISSSGTGSLTFLTNANTQIQFQVAHTASAVNFVQVTGAATGASPIISAQGSDANVTLALTSKGTSNINFFTAGAGSRGLQVRHATGTLVNYPFVTGSVTGAGPVYSVDGTDTNIPLVVQPKGTGALQAQLNDGTATGGNARGANAVDWQTNRNAASQVASGLYSVIAGGQNNTSSQYATFAAGQSNTASNTYAFVGSGTGNTSSGYGACVLGGYLNTAAGFWNFIGNGFTNSGTANAAVTTQSATMNGTTAVTLSGSNANIKVGQLITGTSINIFPNTYVAAISGTSLTLSQAASGSSTSTLSFFTPHGVVVGGGNNQATGAYSFIGGGGDAGTAGNRNVASGDWSFVGGGRTNIASATGSVVVGGGVAGGGNTATGDLSFIGGGRQNVASGTESCIIGGVANTASGNVSTVLGGRTATTRAIIGNIVGSASESPIGGTGVSQFGLLILGRQTTDATATVLTSNTSAASTNNQVILPNNSAYFFRGEVVSGVTGGGNTKGWTIEGVIKRGANAASTALVGTPTVTSSFADAGASTWTIAVTADTTNGGLAVTFTGQAGTTIRTVARINTVEMTF